MNPETLFFRPAALLLLLLVPPLAWALAAMARRRERRAREIAGPRHAALAAEASSGRRRRKHVLVVLGLVALVLAAAQPRFGSAPAELEPGGADLVVALDVSRSMLARDVLPSRLERARREIAALATATPTARIGLVAFAGEARVLAPLTTDLAALVEIANAADDLSVGRGGSDLGAAIESARALLEGAGGDEPAARSIVIVTDGDDAGGGGVAAATRAREAGLRVSILGCASAIGARIPVAGPDGGERFLVGPDGTEVRTALRDEDLRAVADAGGGIYRSVGLEAGVLSELAVASAGAASFRAVGASTGRGNGYQGPLALAILLWTLDLGLTARRRR
ncbi:MAG: VWA domain-containing protein [Planctomycetota bacterium]